MTQRLVLIADDHTHTHRLLHTALGSVEVRTTVNGREAFTIATTDCPELIVTVHAPSLAHSRITRSSENWNRRADLRAAATNSRDACR
jgi:hypothetical protein